MKSTRLFVLVAALAVRLFGASQAGSELLSEQPGASGYLITNDDLPTKVGASSGTIFTLAADGTPQNPFRVSLGGAGAAGGYFTAARVSVLQSSSDACAYLALGSAGEVGAVDIHAMQDIGNFSASSTDSGVDNGIGL